MRLIDADALMQTLGITDMDCEKCEWGDHNHCIRGGDFEDACSAIEDAPTIEPERKTGRWIVCTESFEETFHTGCRCSACNYWKPMGIWNYCPNCGAYMGEDA